MDPPGKWLEKALLDLCKKMETGLDLDSELISGLISYCEFAPPEDAKEYLNVIIVYSSNVIHYSVDIVLSNFVFAYK